MLANYVAHAWMAAIAPGWFFLLGRRFPIGSLKRRMRPWYIVAVVLIAVNVGETVASPPSGFHVPALPTLIAQLVFLVFVVGPSEELLFRGLIQTGLRESFGRWGIVTGALLFGFFHLINPATQPLGETALRVLIAVVIGLVFGALYDRTRTSLAPAWRTAWRTSRERPSHLLRISLRTGEANGLPRSPANRTANFA